MIPQTKSNDATEETKKECSSWYGFSIIYQEKLAEERRLEDEERTKEGERLKKETEIIEIKLKEQFDAFFTLVSGGHL